ncbi:efflux transporter outer membrane subunit [Bacteroidota bacterium]
MKNKSKILILVVLLILGITSCKVGPDFVRPQVSTNDYYRFDSIRSDSMINLKWWELFQDEDLQKLIAVALDNNKDILMAARRLEQARIYVGYTQTDMYPSLGYEGGASRSRNSIGGVAVGPGNSFYFTPTLSWEIDFWGKYRRATEAARAEMMASEYGLLTTQIGLISSVVSYYYQLLDYDARLEVSRNTLESRQQSLKIMQERFNYGTIPQIDLNQAEIQEALAAASIPRFERAVASTENALSIIIGKNPGVVFRTSKLIDERPPPEIPSGIPSKLLQRRPDILQAEQIVHAQVANVGVAQAMRFPSISLTAFLGFASDDLTGITAGNNGIWSLSAGLLGPIFNFGKNKKNAQIQQQKAEESILDYENTILMAFQEVEDALVEIQTYKREFEAIRRQVSSASNASYLSRQRYDGGVTSYLEVLDSETTLFNAQLSASEAYQQYLQSYVKLYKALGGGWIAEGK